MDGVTIKDILPTQVHGHFATITMGPGGSNIPFGKTDLKVVPNAGAEAAPGHAEAGAFTCAGKFVPMQ